MRARRLHLVLFVTLLASSALASEGQDAFTSALGQGTGAAVLAAFVGGLLVSLTPCVYPMVAVTVSVFGARSTTRRWEGLGLSLSFVLGMMAMFVPLGMVAGMTGSVFGAALQSPWVLWGLVLLFAAMAVSMFGAFDLALPSALSSRLATVGGMGHKGAFALGLVSGLIAAPCTGPVLTGILAFIARTRSLGFGALSMASFSLGLGVPFFLVGAFAVKLPKSGRWMVQVKSALGLLLLVVAAYYVQIAWPGSKEHLPEGRLAWMMVATLALVGLLLGAVNRDYAEPGKSNVTLKTLGIMLVTGAGFLGVAEVGRPAAELRWQDTPLVAGIEQARREGRPLLIDFTASWCGACKELDKRTFSDTEVQKEASRFLTIRVDATDDGDPAVQQALARLKVVGLPTVVILDSSGVEVKRFNDFVKAEVFLEALRRVK